MGSALGMNFSLTAKDNMNAGEAIACPLVQAIAAILDPTFPKFVCQ